MNVNKDILKIKKIPEISKKNNRTSMQFSKNNKEKDNKREFNSYLDEEINKLKS